MHADDERSDDLGGDRLLLTAEEAAGVLRVGRTTVYALMKEGRLRSVHIGRSCRISRAELERFVHRLDASPTTVPPRSRPRRSRSVDQPQLFTDAGGIPSASC